MTKESISSKRVLIVGWDGATFDLLKPWVEAGHLPNTARLLQQGAHRILNSTIPTLSPTAWTSFYTGKNPGRHGTFDFIHRTPDTYEIQTYRNYLPSLGTLFRWVSDAGGFVGAINVPFTYPPEQVNGFMISGLSGDEQWEFTHPPELKKELLARDYRIDNPVAYQGDNDEEYITAALDTTRIRIETSLDLMRKHDWNLFMVVFMNIDQLLSFVWHHMDDTHPRHDPRLAYFGTKILELHQLLDRALGDMMAEAGKDATVVLASDHGMGPLYKEVFLNNWLREQGYLVIKENPQTVTRYRQLMRSLGLTREGIWRVIGRARTQQFKQLLPRRLHGLVPTEHPTLANVVDWSKTKAYSMGNIGQIYINLAGREPFGIVNPGSEYDQVIDELKESLMTFCDPETGIPIVDYVYTKDELYDGHFKDRAPDLNIVMQNYGYVTQQRRELASDDLVRPIYSMSGFHRREGIFLAYGPFIQSGEYEPASIIDVTPTLLHLLGLPIPDDMDGQVMHDICTAPLADEESVRRIEIDALIDQNIDLQDEDEERMLHRLKDLGYLG